MRSVRTRSRRSKSLRQALAEDKYHLPSLNIALPIFFSLFAITAYSGFDIAIAIVGFIAGIILSVLFSVLSSSTVQWFKDMPLEFHIYVFIMWIIIIGIFTAFINPYFKQRIYNG